MSTEEKIYKCEECQEEVKLTDNFCGSCGEELAPIEDVMNPAEAEKMEQKIKRGSEWKKSLTRLRSFSWTRKPDEESDVTAQIKISSLPKDIQEWVKNSKPYRKDPFTANLKEDLVIWKGRNGLYLIRTEGFSYPRYMAELVK